MKQWNVISSSSNRPRATVLMHRREDTAFTQAQCMVPAARPLKEPPMSPRNRQAKRAAKLVADTSSAAVIVASSRLLALADPSEFLSARQQREVSRMLSEKMSAGFYGWMSASAAMAALPLRMLQASAKPSAFTPAGCMEAWMAMGGLWIGVGNAALQPARNTVVENRARLRGRRRKAT